METQTTEKIYKIKVRRPEIKLEISPKEIYLEMEDTAGTEIASVRFKIGKDNIKTIKKIIPIWLEMKYKVDIKEISNSDRPFLPDTRIIKKEEIPEFMEKLEKASRNYRVKPIYETIKDYVNQAEKIEVFNYLIMNKVNPKVLASKMLQILDVEAIKRKKEELTELLEERPEEEKKEIISDIEKLKLIEALYLPLKTKIENKEEVPIERIETAAEAVAKLIELLKYVTFEELITFEKIKEKEFPYSKIYCYWGVDVRLLDKEGKAIKLKDEREKASARTTFFIDHITLEIMTEQILERIKELRKKSKEILDTMETENFLISIEKNEGNYSLIVLDQKTKKTKIFKLEETERLALLKDIENFISKNNLENYTYKNYRLEIINKVLYLSLRELKIPIRNGNIKEKLIEIYQNLI